MQESWARLTKSLELLPPPAAMSPSGGIVVPVARALHFWGGGSLSSL